VGVNEGYSMSDEVIYDIDAVRAILPHRPPFLFVDRVIKLAPDVSIIAERDLKPEEFFFSGHFPGKPVMPGVLIADALAQTSGLLWGLSEKTSQARRTRVPADTPRFFSLASVNIKFVRPSFPGDTLRLCATAQQRFGELFSYSVEALVGRRQIAKGSLTLAKSEQPV
jgi:3-hydroxyacyl-[acyl-carrier-protein] dehydratase